MASKVLKVKLWDGEDGKKWKCNVSDIEGEILCGAFLLVHLWILVSSHVMPTIMVPSTESVFFSPCFPILTRTFLPYSLTVHCPRVDEEGKQA